MKFKRVETADMLRKLADMVESGDSAEGSFMWLLGDEPDELEVSGSIRTGNLEGQGGIILVEGSEPSEVPE